jgi:hypothetical protein
MLTARKYGNLPSTVVCGDNSGRRSLLGAAGRWLAAVKPDLIPALAHRDRPGFLGRGVHAHRVSRRSQLDRKQLFLDGPRSIPRNSSSATETGSFAPGTDGSNPSPSSGESAANSIRTGERHSLDAILDRLIHNATASISPAKRPTGTDDDQRPCRGYGHGPHHPRTEYPAAGA